MAVSQLKKMSKQVGISGQFFFPIKYGTLPIERLAEDIESIEPKDRKFGWEKFSFVPFACEVGGTVFISLRDEDYGHVYIYFEDGDGIFEICSSFEEFRLRMYTPKALWDSLA
jgi:hypothetical protein